MSKARNLSDFISDPTISSTEIADQAVTHAKLHTTMDLSSKTVTLPTLSTLNTTGNVGIGTSSPEALLHVDAATNKNFIVQGGTGDVTEVLNYSSSDGYRNLLFGGSVLRFETGAGGGSSTSERMRITSSGNVGIGTTSPSVNLEVSDSGNSFILVKNTSSGSGLYIKADTDGDAEIQTAGGNNNLVMRTSGQERMRIDASGNLLVGTTVSNVATNSGSGNDGVNIHPDSIRIARTDSDMLLLNRLNSDGDIAKFLKDGTAVGSIATYGGDLIVGTGDTRLRFVDSLDSVLPVSNSTGTSRDAGIDLGHSETRFKDIYISGGIYLGAASSSTPVAANKLDDYEEGTWTPTIAGLNNTPTYYNNYGKYTKVGKKVTIQFFQQTNSPPTFSNNSAVFRITGIPFTCDGSGYTGSQGSMNSQGFHFNGSSNNQFATGQVAASVGNDGGLALSFSVTHSGGTRGLVNNGAAGSGYIIEATVTYFTTQ